MNDIELPFLLEHGAWFWKVVLVGCGLLPVGVAWAVSRTLASRRRRRAVEALLRDRHAIRGVLRGPTPGEPVAITVTVERTIASPECVRWTADELWLDTPDRRISIEGSLEVASGSRFRARHGTLPLPPAVAELVAKASAPLQAPPRLTSVRTLVAGDEIVLCGEPVPRPGTKETNHRDADIAWAIGGEQQVLPSAAIAGALPRVRFRVISLLALAGLGVFVGYKLERNRADAWRDACWERYRSSDQDATESTEPVVLDNDNVCVRAASLGFSGSLDRLYEYGLGRGGTDEELAPVITLGRLVVEDCHTRVGRYMYRPTRYEAVVGEARHCGDPDLEYEALVALARFDEAADVLPRTTREDGRPHRDELSVLIAAGRWTEAARVVERFEDDSAACLAAMFRHHAGDAKALGQLRSLVESETLRDPDGERGWPCKEMLAELDPEVRKAWLALDKGGRSPLRVAAGQRGRWTSIAGPEKALFTEPYTSDAALAWLPFTPAAEPRARIAQLRWRTVSQVIHEDLEGAMATAREAVALGATLEPTPEDRYELRHLDVLPSVVGFYALSTDLPARPPPPESSNDNVWRTDWLLTFGRLLVRAGQPFAEAEHAPYKDLHPALLAARDGDGSLLVSYLSKRSFYDPLDVLAIAPYLHGRDRERVAAIMSRNSATPSWLPHDLPAAAIVTYRQYAMLKSVGATWAAARMHAQLQRYEAVFRDRKRLVALSLL